jgi:ferredoxin
MGATNIVTVLPLGLQLQVDPGQTVMAAAHQAGFFWPTVCDASASCGTCVSIIESGTEHCGPMPADEQETLARTMVPLDGLRRLACRLTVSGPVTVKKRGVHQADIEST